MFLGHPPTVIRAITLQVFIVECDLQELASALYQFVLISQMMNTKVAQIEHSLIWMWQLIPGWDHRSSMEVLQRLKWPVDFLFCLHLKLQNHCVDWKTW